MHSGISVHWFALLFASHAAPSLPALRVTSRCKARRCLGGFCLFFPYFFILSLFNAFWYFFALVRFAFRVPRGTIFAGASRDQSLQSSPMRRFIFVLSYFFILSLLSACWYFFALALCSLRVFAKLCVPEKSSFAHMYK